MPILQRRCRECSTRYQLLEMNGVRTSLDHPDIENLDCPSCGAADPEAIIGGALGYRLGGSAGAGRDFPYLDRVLGVEVQSDQHRRQLCKERGIEPTDGDHDWIAEAEREAERAAQVEREYQEELDYQMNGPMKAEYRKALDVIAAEGMALWER